MIVDSRPHLEVMRRAKLNMLLMQFAENRLAVNKGKNQCFGIPHKKHIHPLPLFLQVCGIQVSPSPVTKFLEICIVANLKFTKNADSAYKRPSSGVFLLRTFFVGHTL